MLKAEIIAIGSELLTPHRTDTNSLWLTERLNSIGIDVLFENDCRRRRIKAGRDRA